MPKRDCAAVNIEFFRGDVQVMGRGHGHAGKGFVDFKQIDVRHAQGEFGQQVGNGADGREGEPLGCLCMRGISQNFGFGRDAALCCFLFGQDDDRGRAIVDARRVAGGHSAVF